ncbi:MAG: heavy metal translocating P-type ATPase [Candidatus Berkiella sp.]
MSYKYFRFYLNNTQHNHSIKRYKSILENRKNDGYIRVSFDLIGPKKSLSILCNSKKDIHAEKEEWCDYLKTKKIPISQKIEYGALEDKKHCSNNQSCDHHHGHGHGHGHGHSHSHENHSLKAVLGMAFGLCLLGVQLIAFNIPAMASYIINGISILMTGYLGKNLYQSVWYALKKKKISTATLYTISTLTILGLSILSLIFPNLPMMLESAPLILGFWHLGEAIEHKLLDKINEKLDVRDCAPKTVCLKGNKDDSVSVKKIIPNDIIIIKKDEVIPVDGILNQPALLYTTRVNGSPYPKKFNAGDAVKAGMFLANNVSTLEMRATKTFRNSYLSLIAKNIDTAHQEKAPLELFANKVLKYFVPGLIAISLISGVTLGILFGSAIAIQSVISILVSACPCALGLITPMAVRLGMKKSSENGIHFKHGKALQAAANIDTVVFDLNGTLTEGKPSVNKYAIKDKKLWKYIASLEAHSDHPVSKTIIDFIAQQDIKVNPALKVTHIDKSHHAGIKGIIHGERFIIGNIDMLHANHITEIPAKYKNNQNGTIYMVRGTEVIGQISITDRLRKDAIATVQQLRAMGKQVHICTGADKPTAEYYVKQLNADIPMENICANTVGAITGSQEVSKESYIKDLQERGFNVAMVGDAANDLTAIARADIGVAVKSDIGDKLTEKHAGMTIQKGVLFPIATAFDIAAKTKQNIYQNLFLSLAYNSLVTLAGVGLFMPLGVVLSPGIGVGLMVLESAIVLSNLYRLKIQRPISQANKNIVVLNEEKNSIKMTSILRYTSRNRPSLEQSVDISSLGKSLIFSANSKRSGSILCKPKNVEATTRVNLGNRMC